MIWVGLAMGLVSGFYCGWVARETRMLREEHDQDDDSDTMTS